MKLKNGKKILILRPSVEGRGGVANYYNLINKYFESDIIKVEYYFTGKKSLAPSFLIRVWYSLKDLFYLCQNFHKYDLIHLNPSLDPKALIRDGVYHFVAKRIFRKKTIVFFRGWKMSFEKHIDKSFRNIFKLFFKFDYALVLASQFKDKLIGWGYEPNRIELETTAVDDFLLENWLIEEKIRNIDSRKEIQLLFLARVEKEKGICETIKVVQLLSEKYPNIHLVIAGDGPFMDCARQLANSILTENVSFLGYVRGEEKKRVLLNSDIYIFPTYYGEGMPNSVLEAMAFGLPVVTRPVGGLKDFFIDGEHGFLTESKDPKVIASLIEKIIIDKELWKKMSVSAHEYAKERFMASQVAKRLEDIYVKTLMHKDSKEC